MQDTIPDADRLLARGAPVVLADGEQHRVRYDLEALCRIETEYGSLKAFLDDMAAGADGPFITTVRKGLAFGLHRDGITYDSLADLFDLEQRGAYWRACMDAWNEAMGPADTPGKASAAGSGSRGGSSTTTAPSGSAATPTSSGA